MISKKIFPFFFIQFFILGFGGSIVGPLIPILAEFFKVRLDTIGFILSLNAFGILTATLFSGIIAERFGKKNLFIIGCLLLIISFLGIYFSGQFIFFTIGYTLFGISLGVVQVNSVSIISDLYILNKSKILLRVMSGFSLGNFVVPGMVSIVLSINASWKYIFLSIASLNIILLILILSFKIPEFKNTRSEESLKSLFVVNKKLFSNPTIIFCGIISFLCYGTGFTFSSWFTTYFKSLGVPVFFSSLLLSLYLFILGLGMFLKSFIFAKLNEKKVLQYSSILAFVFLFASIFIEQLIIKVVLILFFGFSFAAIGALSLTTGMRQFQGSSGSVISIISGFGWMGVVVFQYITGYLTENISAGSMIYISLGALFLMIIFTSLLIYNKKPAKE